MALGSAMAFLIAARQVAVFIAPRRASHACDDQETCRSGLLMNTPRDGSQKEVAAAVNMSTMAEKGEGFKPAEPIC